MKLVLVALLVAGVCAQVNPGETETIQISSGGRTRTFLLYVPRSRNPSTPVPIVLSFHGFTNSGSNQASRSRGNEYAEQYGWAMAYPEGVGSSFNGGACCGTASLTRVNDVQFARDIVNTVANRTSVNRNAVFSIGFSNGGFLSYRLACEGSDFIRGVGPQAGRLAFGSDFSSCNPSTPVPIVSITGTSDLTVPYNGNVLLRFPSFASDITAGRNAMGCSTASTTNQVTSSTSCELYQSCNGNAFTEWCTVQRGSHTWFTGGNDIDSTGYFLMRFAQIAGLEEHEFLPPSNETFIDEHIPTEEEILKFQRW